MPATASSQVNHATSAARALDDTEFSELAPASETVTGWIASFNKALQAASVEQMNDLFLADSHWRNIVGIDWRFATVSGRDAISAALLAQSTDAGARDFAPHASRLFATHTERAGEAVIESAIQFVTTVGQGIGLVRLRRDEDNQFRAWSLLTALDALHALTEKNDKSTHADAGPHRHGRIGWLEQREKALRYDERDPQVLVVGGGHNGISAAVELAQQGIDTLVVDSFDRVGDNWRQRYHSLRLHNKTPSNHLPYLPFPSTFPDYIPKDQIANWLESYAEIMEVNIWPRTRFEGAQRDSEDAHWQAKLRCSDGSIRMMRPAHIVMATSTSGMPSLPEIPTLERFVGPVMHSSEYADGSQWRGRPVSVFGTGTSAHDICQDLHSHGAQVTMVQRSPTMIVNLEPSAQLYDQIYYVDGPPIEDRDLINSSVPLALLKKAHKILTSQVREIDAPLLTQLERVGFRLEYGEDNTGWPLKYRQRGGGYYFNVGCSELIARRAIDLIQYHDIQAIDAHGLRMNNGAHRDSELLILATGYHGQEVMVRDLFGDAVADRVGKIWGFDEQTQELRNMWTKTNQCGLWFTAGAFSQARIYSKYLAMQIGAELG